MKKNKKKKKKKKKIINSPSNHTDTYALNSCVHLYTTSESQTARRLRERNKYVPPQLWNWENHS